MKKWFIYVTDHHEGPFTVEEIRQGISEGKFSEASFVWAQGMTDWVPMSTLPDFTPSAAAAPTPAPIAEPAVEPIAPLSPAEVTPAHGVQTKTDTQSYTATETLTETAPIAPVAEVAERTLTTVVEVNDLRGATRETQVQPQAASYGASPAATSAPISMASPISPGMTASAAMASAGSEAPARTGFMKPILILIGIVVILFGLSKAGVLRPLEEKVTSALVKLPELPDVGPEDHAGLTQAAKTPLSQGPAVELVVSRADPLSPAFYVSSNMPEGTRFELYLEGIPHTLLNTLEFQGKTETVVMKNLGKTEPYRSQDGRVIPRGEYAIYVVEAATGQPERTTEELSRLMAISRKLPKSIPTGRKIVFEKKVFLGQKDASYTTRLKEFHDRLVAKAKTEAMELRQFESMIGNQYAQTNATFDRLKKQRLGPQQIRSWKQMDANWLRQDDAISRALAKLTPETTKTDYVYGNVYDLMKQTQKRLNEIHAFQAMYFDRKISLAEAEEQVSQLIAPFQQIYSQFRDAVATIEREPVDANGLPKPVVVSAPPTSASAAPAPGGNR